MRTRVFQDWTTVQISTDPSGGGFTVKSVTQLQEFWLDVSSFAGATFWIDVAQYTTLGGQPLLLTLQTSPTLDESYFQPCVSPLSVVSTNAPLIVQTLRVAGTVPLARYLRWQIAPGSTDFQGTWSVTFRIRAAFSLESFFVPMDVSGCVLWLRADLGIIFATAGSTPVMEWADQSGSGNHFYQLGANQPTYSASGGPNGTPCIQFNGTSEGMSSSTSVTAITQNWTQFALLQNNNLTTGNQLIFATGLTNGWGFDNAGGTRGVLQLGVGAQTFGSATSNWELWTNWDTSGVNSTCQVDGTPITATGNISPVAGTGGSTLGAFNGGASNWWQGNIGELIIYDRTLTANEIARVDAYVRSRTHVW
jgi:hypothetical protein